MNPSVHFSSASDEWETPADFFAEVNAEFGPFDLDPCATPENAKAPRFYTKEQDGLKHIWSGRFFMNPPYGRAIKNWVGHASACVLFHGADLGVCLLPSRTDTYWWHTYVIPYASKTRFIRGRLRFGGAKNSAPFPSALVIFERGGGK